MPLNECIVFSKLNLKEDNYQLIISETSSLFSQNVLEKFEFVQRSIMRSSVS